MDIPSELAQLKKEVAKLKAKVAELSGPLNISETEDGRQKVAHLHCCGITLCNPDDPSDIQGGLWGGEDGPVFSLFGKDGKAHVIISVEKDLGEITVYGEKLKSAVEIGATDKSRGYVAVFDQGKPRAALTTTDEGGAVSLVHDDGLLRVVLRSEADKGEMFIASPDMNAAVKLSSNGPDGGGMMTIHHANGRPGVILATDPMTGMVMVKSSRGKIMGTLPKSGLGGGE